MKIVIPGGTGFIGAKLVLAAQTRGDEVVVVSRKQTAPIAKERVVVWDAHTAPADAEWVRAVDGADAVINLAGASVADEPWTPSRLRVLEESRTESTRAVVEALALAKQKPKVLVNASAIGYYGSHPTGEVTFDESSAPGPGVLGDMCVAWEEAAKSARGVRVALARIGIVLGDGGALAAMTTPYKAFVGGPIGSGKQVLSWIHGDDCVRALLFAVDHEELTGPFNACAPEPATMDEFAKALGRALHRPAVFRAPAFVVRLAMGARATIVLDGQRVVPKRLLSAGFTFEHPSLLGALQHVTSAP